jgi:hypothetical protein
MRDATPKAIGARLQEIALAKTTISYGRLIGELGLPELDGPWPSHPLARIFEVLDQEDADAGRPFRTSVVVSQKTNEPGGGFFEALGRLKGTRVTKQQQTSIWISELNAAHDYPWGG